jgi:hypothetical protein
LFLINTINRFEVNGILTTTKQYAVNHPDIVRNTQGYSMRLMWIPNHTERQYVLGAVQSNRFKTPIRFENNLNTTLESVSNERRSNPSSLIHAYSNVRATAEEAGNGIIQIIVSVDRIARDYSGNIISQSSNNGVIAFTTEEEIRQFGGGQRGVNAIANHVLVNADINLRVDQ